MGLDARKLVLNTDVGVEENAKEVRDCVESTWKKEKKKSVLIAHSKGAIDSATAIARYNLYKHVHAFVALQAPWGGTPFAEAADGRGIFSTLHKIANAIWKADEAAVFDLKYKGERNGGKKTKQATFFSPFS